MKRKVLGYMWSHDQSKAGLLEWINTIFRSKKYAMKDLANSFQPEPGKRVTRAVVYRVVLEPVAVGELKND